MATAFALVSRNVSSSRSEPPTVERPGAGAVKGTTDSAVNPMFHVSNTPAQYGVMAIALHWLMAALLVTLTASGLYMCAGKGRKSPS